MDFERRDHVATRIAWSLMALLVAVALLGLGGLVPIPHSTAAAPLRAAFVYGLLLAVFRLSGKRTLGDFTTFDLVLTLIISECVQQALIAEDNSIGNAVVLVVTLVGLNIVVSLVKSRWPAVDRLLEGAPVRLVDDGRLDHRRMRRERVDENDLMTAARAQHGLERLTQIKHAFLEPDGELSIVPR